jgi:hypothetical protein
MSSRQWTHASVEKPHDTQPRMGVRTQPTLRCHCAGKCPCTDPEGLLLGIWTNHTHTMSDATHAQILCTSYPSPALTRETAEVDVVACLVPRVVAAAGRASMCDLVTGTGAKRCFHFDGNQPTSEQPGP